MSINNHTILAKCSARACDTVAPSQNTQRVACCNSAMGKELELQKACQNFDKATVKKLLQKYCKSGMMWLSYTSQFTNYFLPQSCQITGEDCEEPYPAQNFVVEQ